MTNVSLSARTITPRGRLEVESEWNQDRHNVRPGEPLSSRVSSRLRPRAHDLVIGSALTTTLPVDIEVL